jgi:hypothetical protein
MIVRQPKEVSMDITPIHRRVVGLDVHRHTVIGLLYQSTGRDLVLVHIQTDDAP